MKTIFAIIGSASENSTNQRLVEFLAESSKNEFNWIIFNELKSLPHFDPELAANNPPQEVIAFRNQIEEADGILICTPEYVFSIPSGLKNALEWCVSTTLLSDKPCGLITASARGEMAHEELQLILKTLMAKFTDKTTLLIPGVKGKVTPEGIVTDPETLKDLNLFTNNLIDLV